VIRSSSLYGHYEQAIDRESAYEKLKNAHTTEAETGTERTTQASESGGGWLDRLGDLFGGESGGQARRSDSVLQSAAKSAARAIGSQVGRELIRGVLGSILGGGTRRR
ncbi:MAG: DUF853 family protein, partial [Candidatus Accumulibacter sp.]|nr:DUF853 family protein [Accumulibacter sp.]